MKKYQVEFLDAFTLIFYGTDEIIINNLRREVFSYTGTVITFGLIIAVMIYAFISEVSMYLTRCLDAPLFSNKVNYFWIYLTVLFIGCLLAGLNYRSIKS